MGDENLTHLPRARRPRDRYGAAAIFRDGEIRCRRDATALPDLDPPVRFAR
jgi:hypothetical protein